MSSVHPGHSPRFPRGVDFPSENEGSDSSRFLTVRQVAALAALGLLAWAAVLGPFIL